MNVRIFGAPALWVMAAPAVLGAAAATYGVLRSNGISVLIALLASLIELLLLPFATRSWFKAGRPRSPLGAAIAVVAIVATLPAVYVSSSLINPFLPLMPWERSAIVEAEQFVKRHGFTDSGHPSDQPVLTTDIMDMLFDREQLLNHRRGSLNEHASGIATIGFGQRIVLFEPRDSDVAGIDDYRQVEVSFGRATYMPHQQYWFPQWLMKRND